MPGGASVYSAQTVNSADLGDIRGRSGRGALETKAPEAAIEGGGSEVERGILLPSTLPRSPRPKVAETTPCMLNPPHHLEGYTPADAPP